MPILTGVKFNRSRESQKTIATIEFTTLILCRVRNFIKIEAFAVLRPKLWPKRWQVQTLTRVKNHRKLLSSMNSAPLNCSLCQISWKMVNLIPRSPFPVPLLLLSIFRSSRSQKFFEIGALKNFAIFTGKHLCQESFFNNVAELAPGILLEKFVNMLTKLHYRTFVMDLA